MDLAKVLAELKKELENLDAAIVSLEKLEVSSHKRSGAGKREDEPTLGENAPAEADFSPTLVTPKPRGKSRPA
jgi:hypothetical protein